MTSTSFNVGMSSSKNSSRVLKPPGGGHTNIFGESKWNNYIFLFFSRTHDDIHSANYNGFSFLSFKKKKKKNWLGSSEVKVNNPRPKYDQQNSSNLNFCMNTTDPNILVEQKKQEIAQKEQPSHAADFGGGNGASKQSDTGASAQPQGGNRRVPPGGFSSGLW